MLHLVPRWDMVARTIMPSATRNKTSSEPSPRPPEKPKYLSKKSTCPSLPKGKLTLAEPFCLSKLEQRREDGRHGRRLKMLIRPLTASLLLLAVISLPASTQAKTAAPLALCKADAERICSGV